MTVPQSNAPRDSPAVAVQVEALEDELLRSPSQGRTNAAPHWLAGMSDRLRTLLASPETRRDLIDWLRLPSVSDGSPLTRAVTTWLSGTRYASVTTRQEAASLLAGLLERDTLTEPEARLVVVLGLQYVVLNYVPGHREFRGALIQSNLLSNRTLSDLRHSLRIPHRHGAINWMIAALTQDKTPPFVVTLNDAALDLRGRVAAEDLVCGNRAVCGFVLTQGPEEVPTGYMFISHPVPGLFGDHPYPSAFETRLGELRAQFGPLLANAIEADLITRFAQDTLTSHEASHAPGTSPPIMSLASTSPSGFLAALRTIPEHSLIDRAADRSVECQVNESSFLAALWSQLQLTCLFFDHWADPVARHLDRFARLLDEADPQPLDRPRLVWLPQYRGAESAPHAQHEYYPVGVLSDLNLWVTTSGHTWADWQRAACAAPPSGDHHTEIHARLNAGLSVYSGSHSGYSDLVVPIMGAVADEPTRVRAFLRINCAPTASPQRKRGRDEAASFRSLYQLLHDHVAHLDGTVGALLAWTDEQLVHGGTAALPLGRYKQLSDAARLLADWMTSHITSVLSGRPEAECPSFDIGRYVYGHLREAGGTTIEHLVAKSEAAVRGLAKDLAAASGAMPEIHVVTVWLQTSQPPISVTAPSVAGAAETALGELAILVQHDPGLSQLLSYLSRIEAWTPGALAGVLPLDLRRRQRLTVGDDAATRTTVRLRPFSMADLGRPCTVLDLGVTPAGSEVAWLQLVSADTTSGSQALTLEWAMERQMRCRAKLAWTWATGDGAPRLHPFPAAVSPLGGRVSRRVGAVIADGARLRLGRDLTQDPHEAKSHSRVFGGIDDGGFRLRVRQLEDALLGCTGSPDDRVCWYVVRVAAVGDTASVDEAPPEWLFTLAGTDSVPPVIQALRRMTLSYERGAQLSWLLGEEHYQRASLAEQLAAVSHGYTGPVRLLRGTMSDAKRRWQAYPAPSAEDALGTLERLIVQASGIMRLGDDAITFALRDAAASSEVAESGADVATAVREVLQAFPGEADGGVALSVDDPQQLRRLRTSVRLPLLRHALARLIDNALWVARSDENPQVSVTVSPGAGCVVIAVRNTGRPLTDGELEQIRSRLVDGALPPREGGRRRLGLREAFLCLDALKLPRAVRRPETPYIVMVEIQVPVRSRRAAAGGRH